MNPRTRLVIAAVAFVSWLGWLGYSALTKSRAPVVSRAQAASASWPIVVELSNGEDGKSVFLLRQLNDQNPLFEMKEKSDKPAYIAKVVETLVPNGPAEGTQIGITNIPSCAGYTGPGRYLLLLNADEGSRVENHPAYTLVGQQRSPGADLTNIGSPRVYAWSEDVRKQVRALFRDRGAKD